MASPAIKSDAPMPTSSPARGGPRQPDILPTLFGAGYGIYQTRPRNFIYSFIIHTLAVVLVLLITTYIAQHPKIIAEKLGPVIDISPYLPSSVGGPSGGGGGGGSREKLVASKGALPKTAPDQITPPTVVQPNQPKLPIAPTVVAPQMVNPPLPQMGDPLAAVAPASNGLGSGSGIGSGSGTGVGSGNGPGVGPGWGGGMGGGAYRVGGGVSAPRAIFSPDPEYSEEARKAKYQGDVILWVVIGPDGKVRDVRVSRSLGLGLDEKAVEAVKKWLFEPARKDGQPVSVQLNIDVTFHLY